MGWPLLKLVADLKGFILKVQVLQTCRTQQLWGFRGFYTGFKRRPWKPGNASMTRDIWSCGKGFEPATRPQRFQKQNICQNQQGAKGASPRKNSHELQLLLSWVWACPSFPQLIFQLCVSDASPRIEEIILWFSRFCLVLSNSFLLFIFLHFGRGC